MSEKIRSKRLLSAAGLGALQEGAEAMVNYLRRLVEKARKEHAIKRGPMGNETATRRKSQHELQHGRILESVEKFRVEAFAAGDRKRAAQLDQLGQTLRSMWTECGD